MDQTAQRIARTIASEIGAATNQVGAAVELLDGGATVPFVARYRKEVTGGLDDTQLRTLADRLTYLRELEDRRAAIVKSIGEQGKMTDDLARAIAGAETKAALEDIYLPYKPKRRTKAMIARENGLEPLLRAIEADRSADLQALAAGYVSENVADAKAALTGARDILSEELTENADLLGRLRGPHYRAGGQRQGAGRGEVFRLFRPCRALGDDPRPPGAGHPARLERGGGDNRHRPGRGHRPAACAVDGGRGGGL